MSIFRRAWLSITRRKSKSLLLLSIIFVLGSIIGGAMAVRLASDNVHSRIKLRLGTAVTIEFDQVQINKSLEENPESPLTWESPKPEILAIIGSSPYVKAFEYSLRMSIAIEGAQKYIPAYFQNEEKGEKPGENREPFSLMGVSHATIIDFEEGKSRLISGRLPSEEEITSGASVVLISKELSEHNQLDLGDTLLLQSSIYDLSDIETFGVLETLETAATIIGIYESTPQAAMADGVGNSYKDPWGDAFLDQQNANTLIAPIDFVGSLYHLKASAYNESYRERFGSDYPVEEYQALYILKDPDKLETFISESEKYLPPYNRFVSSLDNYRIVSGALVQTQKLAEYTLLIAIGAAVLIITLVILLSLRDRKQEWGIYLSLGEKRSRLIRQILLETLLIALIGIALSIFSGQLSANALSQSMVRGEIENTAKEIGLEWKVYDKGISARYMNTSLSLKDVYEAYEIEVSSRYLLAFSGASVFVISLSTLLPMLYLLRLNPKKILMGL